MRSSVTLIVAHGSDATPISSLLPTSGAMQAATNKSGTSSIRGMPCSMPHRAAGAPYALGGAARAAEGWRFQIDGDTAFGRLLALEARADGGRPAVVGRPRDGVPSAVRRPIDGLAAINRVDLSSRRRRVARP
jgi:hypothetical protein